MSADPVSTGRRYEKLVEDASARAVINSLDDNAARDFINIISISSFLFHFFCRHPDVIATIGTAFDPGSCVHSEAADMDALRRHKYRELLKITWMDISGAAEYSRILNALSILAESVVRQSFRLMLPADSLKITDNHLCTFALGKLGAEELNFSSDIDLIFVCSNPDDVPMEVYEYQKILLDGIRKVSSHLEQRTAEGFLYRVDLRLRPWGQSGPLVISIDETEHYYEASSEAWERFAWLRARPIAGSRQLGEELINRLQPFIYKRSLSSDDLERFISIKHDMYKARRKKGFWNVKVGEGGIRDLEFFIQMLQLVNAPLHNSLQITGTLNVLSALQTAGLISEKESHEIRHSYLFLRRLENRLQMIDEQQTHELTDDPRGRLIIARSLGVKGDSDDEILDNFENELFTNRSIALDYFERILPESGT